MTKVMTEEWKNNIRKGHLSSTKINYGHFKKGKIPWNKGHTTKNLNPKYCKICNKKIPKDYKTYCSWECYLKDKNKKTHKGIPTKLEIRIKQSLIKTKEKEFKGFRKKLNRQLRNLNEYKEWRFKIFNRDGFICKMCGKTKCYLEAHHLQSLKEIIEIDKIKDIYDAKKCDNLWNINNGITLCTKCHKKIHTGGDFY